ncbi:membrane protein [Brevibacillus panacihumi W25]|uniref:Membrane protein n=1 Tax=Brevibacillus panacihumi W25 TaxID=1408254 RepID=V6M530_9BACL|nr:VanZ family protein [Brevibacillus panacihumi]EST53669.1 membrane protein [Brevibacillus panacihumi W25]
MRSFGFLLHSLLLAAVLIGLFISSSQPYADQDMRGTISKVVDERNWEERLQDITLQYSGREISIEEKGTAGFLEFFLRKGVHFATFAFLAYCWYRVLRYRLAFSTALPWSAFLSLLVAVLDEWHQTFTPDRVGVVQDVLLDLSGSLTMLACICLANLWEKARAKS